MRCCVVLFFSALLFSVVLCSIMSVYLSVVSVKSRYLEHRLSQTETRFPWICSLFYSNLLWAIPNSIILNLAISNNV